MKTLLSLTLMALLTINLAFAQKKCLYSVKDLTTAKLIWTAYKTPKKVGVEGSFDKIEFKANEAEELKTFLLSASVDISSDSVNTGNKERDGKLVKFFFSLMKKKNITAKIQTVKEKSVLVLLSMNGVKKEISMEYSLENNVLTLTSNIDILNWSMNKSLESINKACSALHENKTWSDVSLKVTIPVDHECHEPI